MKITRLSSKRLLLEFPTKKEMNLTNFRITEFKEGTVIHGRYFTPDEFIDFNSDSEGNIKYFSYWEGHNYSVQELIDFSMIFPDITKREISILDAAKKIDNDGYIISMVEGDEGTLRHEIAHGIYFENKEYKEKVDKILGMIPQEIIDVWAKDAFEMGYNEDNKMDELHAYLVAYDQKEWDECFPSIVLGDIIEYRDKLDKLFDEYNTSVV